MRRRLQNKNKDSQTYLEVRKVCDVIQVSQACAVVKLVEHDNLHALVVTVVLIRSKL